MHRQHCSQRVPQNGSGGRSPERSLPFQPHVYLPAIQHVREGLLMSPCWGSVQPLSPSSFHTEQHASVEQGGLVGFPSVSLDEGLRTGHRAGRVAGLDLSASSRSVAHRPSCW